MADITITEGDTLEVDYSLENTGDGTGTFDPRLLVQGLQEDQDTGITLDPAQTATGTLSWPTESGDAVTDAIAEAVTDDTSDSITVTVESAIPDSVVTQHDATKEGSTGGITTISDLIGSRDLSGSASVISNGINGQQSYRFGGTSDLMTESGASEFAAASDDFAFLFVAQQQETPTTDSFYVDGGEDLEFGLQDNNNDELRVYRNSGSFNGTSSLGADQNAHLFLLESVGTSDIRLEVDGAEVATNTNQDGGLIGHTLGGRANDSSYLQVDIGQFEILVNYTSSELSDREQNMADKWGITL
jgi:hypothetical protein